MIFHDTPGYGAVDKDGNFQSLESGVYEVSYWFWTTMYNRDEFYFAPPTSQWLTNPSEASPVEIVPWQVCETLVVP